MIISTYAMLLVTAAEFSAAVFYVAKQHGWGASDSVTAPGAAAQQSNSPLRCP